MNRQHLDRLKNGCIVCNMGHSNTEIDVVRTHFLCTGQCTSVCHPPCHGSISDSQLPILDVTSSHNSQLSLLFIYLSNENIIQVCVKNINFVRRPMSSLSVIAVNADHKYVSFSTLSPKWHDGFR